MTLLRDRSRTWGAEPTQRSRWLPASIACLGLCLASAFEAVAQEPVSQEIVEFSSIRFESDDGVTAKKLRNFERLWGSQTERRLSRESIETKLELLKSLPFIDTATWRIEDTATGRALVMTIVPQQVVRTVEIEGLGRVWRPIFEPAARKVLGLRVGDAFVQTKLDEDVARLQALFHDRGFLSARCTAKLDRARGSTAIVHVCDRGPSYRVGLIEVSGTSAFTPEKVNSDLRPWPWPFYMKQVVQGKIEDVLEEYRDHGYVAATIKIVERRVRPESREIDLVVNVDEGAKLEVQFDGNQSLSRRKLAQALPFRPERSYGAFLVGDGADAIRLAYEKAGYPDVSIRSSRERTDTKVSVRYEIEEGKRFELDRVEVEGGNVFDKSKIDAVVAAERRRWLILAPRWDSTKLEADRTAIASLFRANGYSDVTVSNPRRETGEEGLIAVFSATPGPHYELGSVEAQGVPESLASEIADILQSAKSGEPYRAQNVDRWSQKVAEKLQDVGYLNAAVKPEAIRDGARVDVLLHVTSGPLFHAGPIFLLGNEHTADFVIETALEIEEGKVLVPRDMATSQNQVRSLDVFESIRLSPVGLNAASRYATDGRFDAPIVLRLRERARMEFGAGGSFDTDRGFGGTAIALHHNLVGFALHGTLEGEMGERERAVRVSLADPRLFGRSVHASVYGSYDASELEAFDEQQYTAGIRFAHNLTTRWTLAANISYRFTDTSNVTNPDELPSAEKSSTRALLLTPSLSYDSRDNPLGPTSGAFSTVQFTYSSRALSSDTNFVRIDIWQRRYWNPFDGVVLVAGLSLSDVETYGATRELPPAEILFAGGGQSIRGFEEDRVGMLASDDSPLGGATRLIGNFELRFPIYLPLEGALFVDSGSVVPKISDLDANSLQTAVGAGLRVRTPVGPIRLDFGYKVEKPQRLDRWRIHFSFGYPF